MGHHCVDALYKIELKSSVVLYEITILNNSSYYIETFTMTLTEMSIRAESLNELTDEKLIVMIEWSS